VKAARFEFIRPQTLAHALELLGQAGSRPFAGGQSLGPMLNLRLARPARLVGLAHLPELRHIEETSEGVTYGAALTHAEFEDGAMADPTGGILAAVARGIAYRAVRNRGTIGGSLAHADPAADWPVTLTALGATAHLTSRLGRRQLPVRDLMRGAFETALGPGEIVAAVTVPRLSAAARWGYRKSCRKLGEFAEAMAAVLIDEPRGVARLVVGATEGRHLVSEGPAMASQASLDEAFAAAGLAADPATLQLFRAVVRDALATARTERAAA
jgi:carbon-monoxide dehydrogenase medium subunit